MGPAGKEPRISKLKYESAEVRRLGGPYVIREFNRDEENFGLP
jgi:hypothetical protein